MDVHVLNDLVPVLAKAPHKAYIFELSLDELTEFKLDPKVLIRQHSDFGNLDPKESITIVGVDGAWYEGDAPPTGIKKTHAFVFDFRPIGVHVLFWAKAEEQIRALKAR